MVLTMDKNDYHVIVYRILLYLYTCLKGGEDVFWSSADLTGNQTVHSRAGQCRCFGAVPI